MTNHWVDIKNADVVLVMGGNPAEAHPCGFKWVVEAKVKNRARLIVVDPRFTRTAALADQFAQIRPGTDIAFLGGVIRYLLEKDRIQHDYVAAYTNAPFLVRADFAFDGRPLQRLRRRQAEPTTGPPGPTSSTRTATPRSIPRSRIRAASSSS